MRALTDSILVGRLLAQNFDGIHSPDGAQLSVLSAIQRGMNGGTSAVLTWLIPLVLALFVAIYLTASRRRNL
jgi:hypothetical protein